MKTWNDCVAFHGHECGGLTIGYKASLYAIELLKLEFSADEQVVCIAENDACGVDAVQVMLGCSIGKGNLLFHMRGKQAFSFYKDRRICAAGAETQTGRNDQSRILRLLSGLQAGRNV